MILNSPTLKQADDLENAIDRLGRGEALEHILGAANADIFLLQSMLNTALALRDLRQDIIVPSPANSLNRFLGAAPQIKKERTKELKKQGGWSRLLARIAPIPRMATTAALVAILLIIMFGGTATALAQTSLPGDTLYPLRRLEENIILALPQSAESRNALLEQYHQRRLDEISKVENLLRAAQVDFFGTVEQIDGQEMRISGLKSTLAAGAQIDGLLAVGAYVKARAMTTASGQLIIQRLEVLKESIPPPPPPSPKPSPTHIHWPTETPTPVPTAPPTSTFTPTLMPTEVIFDIIEKRPFESATSMLTPTAKMTPAPASTPEQILAPTSSETEPTEELETPEPDDDQDKEDYRQDDGEKNNDEDNHTSSENDGEASDD